MTTNPFENLASTVNRTKQRCNPKPPMKPSPLQQKLRDQSQQLKRFRAWKREIRAGLLSGEYASEIVQLLRLLRRLPEPEVIIRFVRNSQWLLNGNKTMRYSCFEYIDHVMTRWRVRRGLPPFDDGLFGETSHFVTIRQLLAQEGV